MMDHIRLTLQADQDVAQAVKAFEEFIKGETLAVEVVFTENALDVQNINGHDTGINVERV
ncbi:hypothetical protein J0B03_07650 [Alkalibacter rhizosphaerae]|uniref:Uncharacterized protein n=1 Tax=Alkalibacter rhizosphaerae TaxID=2815577 RepID=A0A975AHP5_9FIRM|nr:DUF5915 domain-containing protein [Alkalibacter rhizosphaerae]QSX07705.1 hypothetical protein J0B03_07650 [Alkalibacter rhizosphaerae]